MARESAFDPLHISIKPPCKAALAQHAPTMALSPA